MLRIPAYEVLANLEDVVKFIIIEAQSGITPPPSCGWSPLPRGGILMDFISILSIFVLACFVGYFVVWSVTRRCTRP